MIKSSAPTSARIANSPRRTGTILLSVLTAVLLAPAATADASDEGRLSLVETATDGSDGIDIDAPSGIAVSPDSKHVYVAGGSTLAVLERTPTGLAQVQTVADGVGGVTDLAGANGVVVSPDGEHVYVTASTDDALLIFGRDVTTGLLTFVERFKEGDEVMDVLNTPLGIAISADGSTVYVTGFSSDTISTWRRNATSGRLTYVEVDRDGEAGVNGLAGANGVAVSPGGRYVYVAGQFDSSLTVFTRSATTGRLTYLEHHSDVDAASGLYLANSVAVSHDGRSVYVDSSGAIGVFARGTDGRVQFVEAETGVSDVNIGGLSVSHDGKHVYVTELNANLVAVFTRSAADGSLRFLHDVASPLTPSPAALTPDGRHFLVGGRGLRTVTDFARTPDTTAPSTRVDSVPSQFTSSAPVTFGFSSTDQFATRFQCSVDGRRFTGCTSPHSFGPLAQGAHSFQVRSIDSAGNVDATPALEVFTVVRDTSVRGAMLKGRKKQRLTPRADSVRLRVKAGAAEQVTVVVRAKVKVPQQLRALAGTGKIRFRKERGTTTPGTLERFVLRPKGDGDARALARLLRNDENVTARVRARFVDAADNHDSMRRTIKLVARQ